MPVLCDISFDFTVSDPACDRLIPTYNSNHVMPFGSSKFRIKIFDLNGSETFEYNNQPLLVQIEGDRYARGQIHARALLFPDRQVGTFQEPLPKYFKLANCSGKLGTAVINDNYVTRRHGSVIWKPPDIQKGPLVFYASSIKDDFAPTNKSLYPIRSHFISPTLRKPEIDGRNCGRSHGCLSIGDDECIFGKNCNMSVKWICYQNKILIEGITYGNIASFGFAKNLEEAVMCTSTKHMIKVEDYVLPRSSNSVVYRKERRHAQYKLLKSLRKKNGIYCRYETSRKYVSNLFVYGGVDAQYGTPEKYKHEKLQTTDLCEPKIFHAISQERRKQHILRASFVTGGQMNTNAHFILVISVLFALLE